MGIVINKKFMDIVRQSTVAELGEMLNQLLVEMAALDKINLALVLDCASAGMSAVGAKIVSELFNTYSPAMKKGLSDLLKNPTILEAMRLTGEQLLRQAEGQPNSASVVPQEEKKEENTDDKDQTTEENKS